MIRRAGLLLIACLALASLGAASPPAKPSKAKTTAVGLGLREYSITLYRSTVRTGRISFNAKNFGEDAHNIQISGPKGYNSAASAEVAPFGGTEKYTLNLKKPGTYTIVCTLSDHAALGMTAKLKVKKAKAKKNK